MGTRGEAARVQDEAKGAGAVAVEAADARAAWGIFFAMRPAERGMNSVSISSIRILEPCHE